MLPNGTAERTVANQRYGLQVTYADGQFNIASGQTGDTSSIELTVNTQVVGGLTVLTDPSTLATELLGMNENGHLVSPQVSTITNYHGRVRHLRLPLFMVVLWVLIRLHLCCHTSQ